jgi:hypothetical protein
MAQAKRVLSTPRRTASKIQEPSCDLAYRRLEPTVFDLDRLCEITIDLFFESVQNPGTTDLPPARC